MCVKLIWSVSSLLILEFIPSWGTFLKSLPFFNYLLTSWDKTSFCWLLDWRMFDFNVDAMHTEASEPFRRTVHSIAGITGDRPDCLLSSLPSELCFNDLRDSAKRHSRKETCAPHNLHCVAVRSSQLRSSACQSVSLSDEDWTYAVDQKAIKANVFSALRQTDVSLGISADGLTKYRTNSFFTKPHVFCQRLCLLQTLRQVYDKKAGDGEDKRMACLKAYREAWISQLAPLHWLFTWAKEDEAGAKDVYIILRSGPHNVLLITVKDEDGAFVLAHGGDSRPFTQLVTNWDDFRVASCQAVAHGAIAHLAWSKTSEWMEIPDYLADFGVEHLPHNVLSKVCTKMKLAKHSSLDHYHRVDMFLRHMGRSEERIAAALATVQERQRKKKEAKEQEESPIVNITIPHWKEVETNKTKRHSLQFTEISLTEL